MTVSPPLVSVVVAHFEQQRQLDRTIHALTRQTHPAGLLEVIVVDDGSRTPPVVPDGVVLLRQEDLGFRLAAARNLGAAHATGSILCFLDADTSPEPGYIAELVRLPAIDPGAVTVGLRRHADLESVALSDPIELAGPAHELPAPAWLASAYERSRDLLDSDHRSYRYLIGAVLACSRSFFDEVGGFDEAFSDYGGEDWEWGYRAWLAGATFAHVPAAVAWHDGPDWSGRSVEDALAAKNREALRLTSAIPAVGSRGRGVHPGPADVVVEIVASTGVAALFVCVDSILEGMPHALVIVPPETVRSFARDPRVRAQVDGSELRLLRARVRIEEPVRVDPPTFAALVEGVAGGAGEGADLEILDHSGIRLVTISSIRMHRRQARTGGRVPTRRTTSDEVLPLRAEPDLEAYLGGWG